MAHRVVSVSYQLRDLHAQRTGFPPHKIAVIHNGVDTRRFTPDGMLRARVRQEIGLAKDEFCIGCVGNLLPVKDQMTLLRAAGLIAGACGTWRLLIAGEGPERSKLEEAVHGHPEWRDRVQFLGLSNSIAELLNAMDVYVLPSIAEGISNSLLEAMATGLPVIATSAGGNPEVVVDGESGLLFPVADCGKLAEHLLLLKRRCDMRLQLSAQAVRRVREDFSLESMADKYARLYQGLVSGVTAPVRAAIRV
jgi:glycosyltransferase involved in cell wall biosynthesis